MSTTKARKSVSVDSADQRLVEQLREEPAYLDAVREASGVDLPDNPTESAALHALIVAGRHAVKDQVMLTGYAALAATQDDEDRAAARAASRRRKRLSD